MPRELKGPKNRGVKKKFLDSLMYANLSFYSIEINLINFL